MIVSASRRAGRLGLVTLVLAFPTCMHPLTASAQSVASAHRPRWGITFDQAAVRSSAPTSESLAEPPARFTAGRPSQPTLALTELATAIDFQAPAPVVAVDYSDAYRLRARIHRLASFAMLPLFAAEAVVGQSLYHSPTSNKKNAHLVVAGAIAGLFGVNSVTGVWNLIEARRDPEGRTRRLVHGILMLAADAGFLATAALGPQTEHRRGGLERRVEGSPATHRAVAFATIGTATVGYLVMLFGGR